MKIFNLKKQQGSGILVMILTIVAIFSAISYVMLRSPDTTNLLSSSAINNTIVAQAGMIRSKILACGLEYPEGNNGTTYRVQYPPANPNLINASAMTCPGANNANLWTLSDGIDYPSAVDGFANWRYVNNGTNMRISIVANTPDKIALLPAISNMLGNKASVSGNTLNWIIIQ